MCAMEKKTLSRPMTEILTRLEEFEYIKTLIFPESVIINVSLYPPLFAVLNAKFAGACR